MWSGEKLGKTCPCELCDLSLCYMMNGQVCWWRVAWLKGLITQDWWTRQKHSLTLYDWVPPHGSIYLLLLLVYFGTSSIVCFVLLTWQPLVRSDRVGGNWPVLTTCLEGRLSAHGLSWPLRFPPSSPSQFHGQSPLRLMASLDFSSILLFPGKFPGHSRCQSRVHSPG